MPAFKVRMCPLCTATSILNKSAAMATYSLSAADLASLPQYTDGQPMIIGSNIIMVTMYFVRDLERAAWRKYGGKAAFEAHRAALAGKKEVKKAAKESGVVEVKKDLKELHGRAARRVFFHPVMDLLDLEIITFVQYPPRERRDLE